VKLPRPYAKAKRHLWRWLAQYVVMVALATASTMPLASFARSHLPVGAAPTATVPLLNVWTIDWNVNRIDHGYRDYWDAPIYFPTRGVLAGSEPQPVTGWLAWPIWKIVPNPVLAYNVLIIQFLALNGWFTCRLLERLRLAWPASWAGGAMICLLPLVHWQIDVFQLLALWCVVWTLIAFSSFARRPTAWRAVHVAAAFACTYGTCCYYGLFLSILLLITWPVLCARRLRDAKFWLWTCCALAVAALLVSPICWAQMTFTREHGSALPAGWFRELSVNLTHFRRTPGRQLVPLPGPATNTDGSPWALSPGTFKMVLAGVGLVWGVWTRRRRRFTLFCTSVLVLAILLAMGPRLNVFGFSPHDLLTRYYPGFDRARNLFRFVYFAHLMLVVLAAIGLHAMHVRLTRFIGKRRAVVRPPRRLTARAHSASPNFRSLIALAMFGLGAIVAVEAWPPPRPLHAVPSIATHATWVRWLRDAPEPAIVLACFPLASGPQAAEGLRTAEWMYFQMFHRRPMINGYSGMIPTDYLLLKPKLAGFPSRGGVSALCRVGVTHCLLDTRICGTAFDAEKMRAAGMHMVVDDTRAGIQIWALRPATTPRP